jgi:hypothetical protein
VRRMVRGLRPSFRFLRAPSATRKLHVHSGTFMLCSPIAEPANDNAPPEQATGTEKLAQPRALSGARRSISVSYATSRMRDLTPLKSMQLSPDFWQRGSHDSGAVSRGVLIERNSWCPPSFASSSPKIHLRSRAHEQAKEQKPFLACQRCQV